MPKKRIKCPVIVTKAKGRQGTHCKHVAKYKFPVELGEIITAMPLCEKHSKEFEEGKQLVINQRNGYFVVEYMGGELLSNDTN